MIDESVLERLLREEAATYDPPADGPAQVLEAAAEEEVRQPRRTTWLAVAAAAVVIAVGVPLAQQGLPSFRTSPQSTAGYADDGGRVVYADRDGGESGGGAAPPQAYDPGQQNDGAHVVRTGETWLEVPRAKVPETLRAVSRIAGAHGGYVARSDTQTAGDDPSGDVTLRVPVAAFDRAIEEVGRLGDVRQSTTGGEDVSGQVTDTAARLRSALATRAQLRTLLARASSIADVLAVQERLDEVQTEIEKLQATQESLKDRTSFGTLRVSVTPPRGAEERGGFSKAWHDALDGFVGGLQGLLGASGTILFALLVAGAVFLLARLAYRAWFRAGVV